MNNDGFLDFNEYNDRMMEIINNPETLKQLSEEEQESLRADNQRNTRRFLEADKNQVYFITYKLFDDKNRMVNLIEKNLVHFFILTLRNGCKGAWRLKPSKPWIQTMTASLTKMNF